MITVLLAKAVIPNTRAPFFVWGTTALALRASLMRYSRTMC